MYNLYIKLQILANSCKKMLKKSYKNESTNDLMVIFNLPPPPQKIFYKIYYLIYIF